MRKRPSFILFAVRLLGLAVITILLLSLYGLLCLFIWPASSRTRVRHFLLKIWGKWTALNNGYKIKVVGDIPGQGCFLAPNHISYADIIVLSSLCPCSFISKAEVAKLPIIGYAATRVGTIYVSRRRERKLGDTHEQISKRLRSKNNVAVFLESTTSDGRRLLPFRSTLLQGAIDSGAPVQPIAMQWQSNNPNLDVIEDIAFWRDDHYLLPHLINHLGRNSKQVEVRFGQQIEAAQFDCRKVLAEHVYLNVKALLDAP